jgi:hypothetical protein
VSTTLEAPQFMTRREAVRTMFADLPAEALADVTVEFANDSYPTTSFIDELIRVTVVENRASQLRLTNVDSFTAELVVEAADLYRVQHRVTIDA